MTKNINAYCEICGEGYYICKSCSDQVMFKPWKAVVDTIEHYKIFLVLYEYKKNRNKKIAKKELENCNLSDMENFKSEIKSLIKEILSD